MSLLCLAIFCALSQVCRAQHLRNSSSTHTGQLPRPSVRPNTTERQVSRHANVEPLRDPTSSAAALAVVVNGSTPSGSTLYWRVGESDSKEQMNTFLDRFASTGASGGYFVVGSGADKTEKKNVWRWFVLAQGPLERSQQLLLQNFHEATVWKSNVHTTSRTSYSTQYHTRFELVQRVPAIAIPGQQDIVDNYNVWYWLLRSDDPEPSAEAKYQLIYSFKSKEKEEEDDTGLVETIEHTVRNLLEVAPAGGTETYEFKCPRVMHL